MYRRLAIYVCAASFMLLTGSCMKEIDYSVYNGDYPLSTGTSVTKNGHDITLSDYSDAGISIALASKGGRCEITLNNLISGQDRITFPASITATSRSKGRSGGHFSGTVSSGDRNITVEGHTRDGALSSLNIKEDITIEGIAGHWCVHTMQVTFSHPEFKTVDLSGVFPTSAMSCPEAIPVSNIVETFNDILRIITSDPGFRHIPLEFTPDGYIGQDNPACYFVEDGHLNIYLRPSVVDSVLADGKIAGLLDRLYLTSVAGMAETAVIPLEYTLGGDGDTLFLIADEHIPDNFLPLIQEPMDSLKKSLYGSFTVERARRFLIMLPGGQAAAQYVNENNYTRIVDVICQFIDALTDGRAEHSIILGLYQHPEY